MICEYKSLSSMDLATLFGKLQKDEIELKILADDRESDKKKRKSIALEFINIKDIKLEDEDNKIETNEDMKLMFQKLLRHKKNSSKIRIHSNMP